MGTIVPRLPLSTELATHLVAEPVSATAVGRVWASQEAFLLGYALPSIAAVRLPGLTAPTTTAYTVSLFWRPSPGCRLAALVVDPNLSSWTEQFGGRDVTDADKVTIAVTTPTGAGLVHTGVLGIAGSLDGSTALNQQDPFEVSRSSYASFIHLGDAGDVADDVHEIRVTVDDVSAASHSGLATITLVEVPLGTLQPENGEVGPLLPYADARNELHDGDSGAGTGVIEYLTGEQDARTKIRQHVQIATYEDTGVAWYRGSTTVGALNWAGGIGTGYSPKFRIRVRAPMGTSAATPAAYTLLVRHNSNEDWTLRVVRAVVGSGTSNHNEPIAASGGVWATHEGSITLRADGTDQEIDLEFQLSSLDGSTVYVCAIALIQDEVI